MTQTVARVCAWCLLRLGWLVLRTCFFVRVKGAERIPRKGALLVIANHPTYLDPVILTCICMRLSGRPVAFMAWDKLFAIPLVGPVLRLFGAFPVNLERPGRKPWEHMLATLRSGQAVGLFPEGERSRDAFMQTFKRGALEAAHATDATVLLVSIAGAHKVWPPGLLLPRLFRRIHVTIHPPLKSESLCATGDRKSIEASAESLRARINAPLEVMRRRENRRERAWHRLRGASPLTWRGDAWLKGRARETEHAA